MAKIPVSIRLEPEEIEAAARAAADDKRPVAMLLRLIITSWLAERGYLGENGRPAAPAAPKGRGTRARR
jgi:hypothetical protein